jgi:hypothetical protein
MTVVRYTSKWERKIRRHIYTNIVIGLCTCGFVTFVLLLLLCIIIIIIIIGLIRIDSVLISVLTMLFSY